MPTQKTTRLRLQYWQKYDRDWHLPYQATVERLEALSVLGALAVRTLEDPSTTLNVAVAAGSYRKADGTIVDYAGSASFALTASATNSIYLTDAGVLSKSTTGWPATSHVRLAVAVVGATTITSFADARMFGVSSGASGSGLYLALTGGTMDDAAGVVTVNLGSANGTKVGATGNKLGFLGATPVVQQANGVDLAALLATFGLRASGGNPPLNLGSGAIACGALTVGGTTTLADGQNVVVNTATGSKIATATGQKLGFWNATPIVQPAHANQAALGTLTLVTMTDSTTGTPSDTMNDVTGTFSQSILNDNFASLLREVNRAVADFASVKTLVNQLRADLVAAGILKGSA